MCMSNIIVFPPDDTGDTGLDLYLLMPMHEAADDFLRVYYDVAF